MKRILLTSAFVIALHGQAVADDRASAVEMAANDLSHEMSICAAFHKIMGACLLTANVKDGSEQARQAAIKFLELAEVIGKGAGIKIDKVLIARDNMATKDMREAIDDNCGNISILLDEHGERCKKLAADPETALKDYIEKALTRAEQTPVR